MRKIKSFRLFESNDRLEIRIKEIVGVYEDVKSLEYILEEGDYDFSFRIYNQHNSYNINDNISDLIRDNSFSGDGTSRRWRNRVFHHDFLKPVTICINILGIGGKLFNEINSTTIDKVKVDMSRFKTLLEQHLDYLPDDSIKLFCEKSGTGWIGNYKINISI